MEKEAAGGFYVTLASNASAGVYPQNKIWNFRTKLAKAIHTTQPYEVGLIEAQYPCRWLSFPWEDAVISLGDSKTGHTFLIATGFYESITRLLEHINKTIAKHTPQVDIKLYHESIRNRVYIKGSASYLSGLEENWQTSWASTPAKCTLQTRPERYTHHIQQISMGGAIICLFIAILSITSGWGTAMSRC